MRRTNRTPWEWIWKNSTTDKEFQDRLGPGYIREFFGYIPGSIDLMIKEAEPVDQIGRYEIYEENKVYFALRPPQPNDRLHAIVTNRRNKLKNAISRLGL